MATSSYYTGVMASRILQNNLLAPLPGRWRAPRMRQIALASTSSRPHPHHLAQRPQRRAYADAPASRPAGKQYNAVKAAQEQIEKHGKAPSMPGMSAEMQVLPLQDAHVLPPLSEIGVQQVGGVMKAAGYVYKRVRRWVHTLRSASTMNRTNAVPLAEDHKWWKAFFLSGAFKPLVKELQTIYVQYNEAQAAGNVPLLRHLAANQALTSAQARIASLPPGTTMRWTVDAWHGYPFHADQQKLVNLRVIEADLKAAKQLAQIIVRFDSDQTLTITQRNKPPVVRSSRVREYWLFERMISDRQARWKIRERIEPYKGGRLPLGMA